MKAHYRTRNNRIVVELQADTQKALFRAISQTQDVFEAADNCGQCGSDNLKFSVRTVEEHDYYELLCLGCRATLKFGQHKKGDTLFPKRDGVHHGWTRYALEAPQER